MMQRVVKKRPLTRSDSIKDDLEFWLRKMPEERIAAVELLRKQHHGSTARLQRVARVVQQASR